MRKIIEKENLIKSEKLKIEEIINETETRLKGNYFVEVLRVEYFEKLGKLNEVIELLKGIIDRNRKNYYAWEKLLLILSDKKDYKELFNYAKECSIEFNMSYLAKIMYASAAIETGEFDIAKEEIKKARILSGNQTNALVQTMIIEADLHYKKKEFEKAYGIFEEALKLDPENNIVLNNYSYYLAENGVNLAKAEKMILKVVKKDPKNAVFLDTYAWILYKKGKNRKAFEIMKYIIDELSGDDPEYFEHFGFILKRAGKFNEAIKYWKIAFEKDNRKEDLLKEIENCRAK